MGRTRSAMAAVAACMVFGCGASPQPPPAEHAEPPPAEHAEPPPEAAVTQLTVFVAHPGASSPPCSAIAAQVDGGEPLELGEYCGLMREDREAAEGIVNVQGFESEEAGEPLWRLRVRRAASGLVFERRDGDGDWRQLASVEADLAGGVTTEIRWPTADMPTPAP